MPAVAEPLRRCSGSVAEGHHHRFFWATPPSSPDRSPGSGSPSKIRRGVLRTSSDMSRAGYFASSHPREGLALHAIASGIFAGLVFGVGESLVAVAMGRSLLAPVPFTSLVLKPMSDVAQHTLPVVVAGVFVHFVTSVVFALSFFVLTGRLWRAGAKGVTMVLLGTGFGVVVWLVNLHLLTPLFFPKSAGPHRGWEGLLTHTFLFGTALGFYAGVIPRRAKTYPRNR